MSDLEMPPGACFQCWSRGRNPNWEAEGQPDFVWFNPNVHGDDCTCECHQGGTLRPHPSRPNA